MKKLMFVGILFITVCGSVGMAGVPCGVVPVPPSGWAMICNPCDGGVTTIDVFLPADPTIPEGTTLYKYNGVGYDMEAYGEGAWNPGTMTLSPGEGAYVSLIGPAALGFDGVPFALPPNVIAIPAGWSIRSAPSGLGMLGFPAMDGDTIFRLTPTLAWDVYVYMDGLWDPAVPVFGPGEAFWVFKGAPGLWVQ